MTSHADKGTLRPQLRGSSQMNEELVAALRRRLAERYYDHPQVIDIIARALMHARGLYPPPRARDSAPRLTPA